MRSYETINMSRSADRPAGWTLDNPRPAISRAFRFADFRTALSFMNRVGEVAERLDHHPEWFNVYNVVEVTLTTHDAAGLTALDYELAREMNRIGLELGAR